MTNITETFNTFLPALNHAEADTEVQSLLNELGGEYTTEVYNDTGVEEKYFTMPNKGVDFLLENGVLTTVFIHQSWNMKRDDVRAMLGEPVKTATLYDLYEIDGRFAHFEFDALNSQLTKLTLMAHDPRITSVVSPAEGSTSKSIEGTLNTLTAAIGHAELDSATQAAIALFESEYAKDDPSGGPDVITQYLNLQNGHIQLKNNAVANIYFTTGLSFNDPAPAGLRMNNLIIGLSENPTREAIAAVLGEPYLKDANFDLYNSNGTSVHIEYINNVPDSISVGPLPENQ